jgi:hypothetical protein
MDRDAYHSSHHSTFRMADWTWTVLTHLHPIGHIEMAEYALCSRLDLCSQHSHPGSALQLFDRASSIQVLEARVAFCLQRTLSQTEIGWCV